MLLVQQVWIHNTFLLSVSWFVSRIHVQIVAALIRLRNCHLCDGKGCCGRGGDVIPGCIARCVHVVIRWTRVHPDRYVARRHELLFYDGGPPLTTHFADLSIVAKPVPGPPEPGQALP